MLPGPDLEEILVRHEDDVRRLAGARLLVTGGTGFVGTWLLASLVHACDRLALGCAIVVLTRDPAAFAAASPSLARHGAVALVRGDVRTFDFAAVGGADAVVHAATPASAALARDAPLEMLDTIVEGTRRVLDYARLQGRIRVLFTSSGAVYGAQPATLPAMDEDYRGGPDPLATSNAYHEGKRVAELRCAIHAERYALDVTIARLFAFVGPRLPLDRHFAIGNFVADALAGGPIAISGDGTAVRSYQYAAEMTGWLWRIFARGAAGRAYNVGSEEAHDLASVARAVARIAGLDPARVTIARERRADGDVDRYVPSTARARHELDLTRAIALDEAIARTIAWHRAGLHGTGS